MKADEEAEAEEEGPSKKAKQEEAEILENKLIAIAAKEFVAWLKEMDEGTDRIWQATWGDRWEEAKRLGAIQRERLQKEHQEKLAIIEENARKRKAKEHVSLKDPVVFLDDLDPRY